MSNERNTIELFTLKCAVIESKIRSLRAENSDFSIGKSNELADQNLDPFIKQFKLKNRQNAAKMAVYYQIFYMLENEIRELISETMASAHGEDWWISKVPQVVREEAKKNQSREEQAGVTARSEDEIDYITFGQLYEIIKDNWSDFAGIMSNQSAVSRVLSSLNMLRGTIAHCGVLADDEVDRLKLAIRDWFRVLEGPK